MVVVPIAGYQTLEMLFGTKKGVPLTREGLLFVSLCAKCNAQEEIADENQKLVFNMRNVLILCNPDLLLKYTALR